MVGGEGPMGDRQSEKIDRHSENIDRQSEYIDRQSKDISTEVITWASSLYAAFSSGKHSSLEIPVFS